LDQSGFINPVTNFGSIYFSSSYQGLFADQPWVIDNRGLIEAAAPDGRNVGVVLAALGSVINYPGATIAAGSGVAILGDPGVVRNGGLIAGGYYDGVRLADGGTIFNAASATLTGAVHAAVVDGAAGTIVNGGVMAAGGAGGAVLAAGGTVVNAGLLLAASYAVTIGGGPGTLVNEGTISAGHAAVALAATAFVANFDVIEASAGVAVTLMAGGMIYNALGIVSGGAGIASSGRVLVENSRQVNAGTGAGVSLGAGGTVLNTGAILSTLGVAVTVSGGGTVATGGNGTTTGVISGAAGGVVFSGGAGTVIDDGTIAAGDGAAIVFAPGFANLLAVGGDSLVSGPVDGGNTIGAAVASTLVLGGSGVVVTIPTIAAPTVQTSFYSGVDGAVSTFVLLSGSTALPTFSGLGTRFTDFATIVNASGWQFSPSDAIPAGVTLFNQAVIEGGGVSLGAGSELVNALAPGAGYAGLPGIDFGYSNAFFSYGSPTTLSQAVFAGSASPDVTIVSQLGITDLTTRGSGIVLLAGGTVTNAFVIDAEAAGISLNGPGLILNEGATTRAGGGTTYYLHGVIEGSTGIDASGTGSANAVQVINKGTILGRGGDLYIDSSGFGVALASGNVTNDPGATISGEFGVGLVANAYLRNGGLVAGTTGQGAQLDNGGTVFNAAGATISGAAAAVAVYGQAGLSGTVINGGLITGGEGVHLSESGKIVNLGTLTAGSYAAAIGLLGTLLNEGGITAASGAAVLLSGAGAGGAGTVENFALIKAAGGVGVQLGLGAGTVFNNSDIIGGSIGVQAFYTALVENPGYIAGGSGPAVRLGGGGTLINTGWIRNTLGVAISIAGGGTVANSGFGHYAGVITGGAAGIVFSGGAGTVLDDGTIESPGTPIVFARGYANLLAVSGDSAVSGVVDGGNTIGAAVASTLVLGAASITVANVTAPTYSSAFYGPGSGSGFTLVTVLPPHVPTFSALGTRFTDFATIVNTTAWSFNASDALPTGVALVNEGYIGGAGVTLGAGGRLTNAGTIVGVTGSGLATIDNAGTISGGSAAVLLAAGYADRVIVRRGAVFQGLVDGGNAPGSTVVSTLELAAGVGTLAGLGSQFTNFGAVAVDAGSTWTLAGGGTLAAGARADVAGTLVLGGVLSGAGAVSLLAGGEVAFTPGDAPSGIVLGGDGTIEVIGAMETIAGSGGGRLTLAGDAAITLDVTGSYHFSVGHSAGNSYVTACFAEGTAILTGEGPRRVEALRLGIMVVTAGGRLAPVAWIGRRRLSLGRHPRPWDVMPVRVLAGAFGEGVPGRDLVLSPDHAVLAGGVLIPVRYLINGDTIAQETRDQVTYWHVELDRHEVIFAEGLACESYLDTGNRDAFEGGAAVVLHPSFAGGEGCLPLVLDTCDGRMVAARAGLLALAGPVTGEAEIGLLLGESMLRPRYEAGRLVFELPEGCDSGTLVSLTHVPAHVRAESDDTRVLGVAVAGIWIDGRRESLRRLGEGWHAAEPGHRWTDGAGVIPLRGARRLVLRLGPPGLYRFRGSAAARTMRHPVPAAAMG
jgi:hypothetical protein